MSLHYSSGKLLLKNITDNLWYYVEVRIDSQDEHPHIYVHQEASDEDGLSGYDEYAIICADNGDIYKLGLYTNSEDVVTYSFESSALTKPADRVFVKDTTTGVRYSLTGVYNETYLRAYLRISQVSVSAALTTVDSPFRCHAAVTYTANRCKHGAAFYVRATIVTSRGEIEIEPTPEPEQEGILDEGGVEILDEGGEAILEG